MGSRPKINVPSNTKIDVALICGIESKYLPREKNPHFYPPFIEVRVNDVKCLFVEKTTGD